MAEYKLHTWPEVVQMTNLQAMKRVIVAIKELSKGYYQTAFWSGEVTWHKRLLWALEEGIRAKVAGEMILKHNQRYHRRNRDLAREVETLRDTLTIFVEQMQKEGDVS